MTDLQARLCDGVDWAILNETNTHEGGEECLKLSTFSAVNMCAVEGKKLGFGTAVLTKKLSDFEKNVCRKLDKIFVGVEI